MAGMKRNSLLTGVAAVALSLTPIAAHATAQPGASARRAQVTDIREIQNNRTVQLEISEGDNGTVFTIPANRRWNGTIWVPWVGRDGEMSKSIHIVGGNTECWVFQDYWNTHDLVRYSRTKSYTYSAPVLGANTGAGRKVLLVGDNCALTLEPVA
jgi:hypothetical protein